MSEDTLADRIFAAMEALGIEDTAPADARFIAADVEEWLAAHVARATADAEARLALIRAECDAAEDHGIEDEDGERWVLVPIIRAALNAALDPAPTTDADTRRDDAGAKVCWRGECRDGCYYPETCTEGATP